MQERTRMNKTPERSVCETLSLDGRATTYDIPGARDDRDDRYARDAAPSSVRPCLFA
jgi:hypothetical protein